MHRGSWKCGAWLRVLGVLGLFAGAGCQAPVFDAAARAQMLTLGGNFGASTSGATAASSVEALGLDDNKYLFSPRVDVEAGPWHFSGDAFVSSLTGEGNVEGSLSLGGITLNTNDPVKAALDLGYARALATFDFIPTQTVDLGIGLGVVYADVSAEIEDVGTGQREEVGEAIIGPVAAVHGRVHFGRFNVGVDASGIAFDVDDVDVMHVDIDASANLELVELGGLATMIEVGYRYLVIDVEFNDGNDQVDADLDYSGPYIGLRLSF